jgi:hypothetical protein
MMIRVGRLAYALTVFFAAGLPSVVRATEVRVENYSNDTVYVAVAYNNWNGNLAAEGWYEIKSNDTRTFNADDSCDMYLRITRNGNEVTFQKHNTFLSWPVEPQLRFSVSKEPDDATIRVLRWGTDLEMSDNIKAGGNLPAGWKGQRFFRVGAGGTKLEIRP